MNLVELKKMRINELTQMAADSKIDGAAGTQKQALVFSMLQAHS